jgi:outer membrane biosynthesis protein TonB
MGILRVSFLTCMALAATAHAFVQAPPETPTSGAHPRQELSKRERISLCEKKMNVPIDPSDPQPLRAEGKVTRPVPIYQPKPDNPGNGGQVVLEAVIDEDGCVRGAKLLKGEGAPASVSLKAASHWVFKPATLDGNPVRVFYVLTFNFQFELRRGV